MLKNSVLNEDSASFLSLREELAAVVDGMIYLSESEASLELMDWRGMMDLADLQQRIATLHSVPPHAQTIIRGADFLASILAACDPSDKVLMDYAAQYKTLFGILFRYSDEVSVIRAGHTEVHIYIASLGKDESLILHTTAIET